MLRLLLTTIHMAEHTYFGDTWFSAPRANTIPSVSPGRPGSYAAVVARAGVLGLMFSMTGLTFVKELAMFQVIQTGLWMQTYHFARDHYYDCLFLSFALALTVTFLPRTARATKQVWLLVALWMVGGLNVFLFTANNGINLLAGRPLHCHHQGIGW
jgi:hypothetical protein